MKKIEFTVDGSAAGLRLDACLAQKIDGLSRSRAQKLIEQGNVQVNGLPVFDKDRRVLAGERVAVELPPPMPLEARPEAIPLRVVFEDRDLLVIDKPRDMVVHPAPGHAGGTLVNALLHHCGTLSEIGGKLRPGIVHRLDKDTSGLILVAKNDRSHHCLARQLKERTMRREYLALVKGRVYPREGRISAPIGRHPVHRKRMAVVPGGREAVSYYQVIAYLDRFSLVQVQLETGRTHQVRVHMAHLGHPVAGDPVYGSGNRASLPAELQDKQFLHAHRIAFYHPRHRCLLQFAAPLPLELRRGMALLRRGTKDLPL